MSVEQFSVVASEAAQLLQHRYTFCWFWLIKPIPRAQRAQLKIMEIFPLSSGVTVLGSGCFYCFTNDYLVVNDTGQKYYYFSLIPQN